MTDQEKREFEIRMHGYRRAARVREEERNRMADKIELLIYGAKSQEACDVLVELAHHILDGARP